MLVGAVAGKIQSSFDEKNILLNECNLAIKIEFQSL